MPHASISPITLCVCVPHVRECHRVFHGVLFHTVLFHGVLARCAGTLCFDGGVHVDGGLFTAGWEGCVFDGWGVFDGG